MAVRVFAGKCLHKRKSLLAAPLGEQLRRPAADVGFGRLEVAVQVADAAAAGVFRLPDLPALAALAVAHHEPVVRRDPAEERDAGAAQLDDDHDAVIASTPQRQVAMPACCSLSIRSPR
jgi:hypothetical protein